MRAYSHQGHGPRADQTGRIHISDFRNPRTISLAKGSRSIHWGHQQKSIAPSSTSGFPRKPDITAVIPQVRSGPRLCENPFQLGERTAPASVSWLAWASNEPPKCSEVPECPLCLHGRQQWSAAQDRYYAFDVVGEYIKRHLGCHLVSSSHEEVCRTHPGLYGPERVLCRLPA